MRPTPAIRRVCVVVLDGLRPDALDVFDLVSLQRLRAHGAATLTASTVRPSVTWPAMTSLLVGVSPSTHGITRDTPHLPRPKAELQPLSATLGAAGMPSSAHFASLGLLYRPLGSYIAKRLGFYRAQFQGETAPEIARAAARTIDEQDTGLLLFHLPDADRAGHDHGWMSPEYGAAARRLDAALGLIVEMAAINRDPGTLLIALADHGGGGVDRRNHMSNHPVDTTIPIIVAGAGVCAGDLHAGTTLLDVPKTVAWALGVRAPASWTGRALTEAFAVREPAIAVA